jgi:DNA-3-methyladenine glycosylase I
MVVSCFGFAETTDHHTFAAPGARMSQSYCEIAPNQPFHREYHAREYGFPVADDQVLFERLVLEINQAGLSWLTILKKRDGFRRAYAGFAIATVAAFDAADRERLLADASIIRNRLKVDAAIENARRILVLAAEYGSFKAWLDAHHPLSHAEWTLLFKQTFRFTGSEIVREFLVSTGHLPGAHTPDCPVYAEVLACNPPWLHAPH